MNTIQTGQTLTARSICDSQMRFSAVVIERKGSFATVETMGTVRRVKVRKDDSGEFLFALGQFSMAPVFRP